MLTVGIGGVIIIYELEMSNSVENRRDYMRTLKECRPGDTVYIRKVHGEGPTRRRLMDMGLTRNTGVFVRKFAPLGDPVEIALRGYELTIRLSEAELIELYEKGEEPEFA